MRIPSPDDAALAAVGKLVGPLLRAGLPIPACLMAIEVLRLAAGVGVAVAFLVLAGDRTQGAFLAGGALLMVWSSLLVIPVFWSEWRGWEAELEDYYRVRGRRRRKEGAAGRSIKLGIALALSLALVLSRGVTGLPQATGAVGLGIALLLWIDVLSVYAASLEPVG